MASLDRALVTELWKSAHADRWELAPEHFEAALVRSLAKIFPDARVTAEQQERCLRGLHLEDLALASACEHGHDAAWEHFVREFRPQLYRAAEAIDRSGNGRELADGLYGELFGRSLLRYFHGRSSLATWLRAVLSQRYVDRLRGEKRVTPLSEESAAAIPDPSPTPAPDRARHVAVLVSALAAAVAALAPRERLRLACYHAQSLTLAQIGRLTGEHEATVSRHLTRTRREVRSHVEAQLRRQGMGDAEIAECFTEAVADAGSFSVEQVLASDQPGERKPSGPGRSR